MTKHGRATPLLWKTVVTSELKGWRNEHEDVLLERLRQVLPEGVRVKVLADRGFGDQALYELLKDQLGFDFVVRFRGIVKVADEHGVTKTAAEWVPENGRARLLRKVGHAHQLDGAARPHPARGHHRHRAFHAPRRSRRIDRSRPDDEGQHREDPDTFTAQPGAVLL